MIVLLTLPFRCFIRRPIIFMLIPSHPHTFQTSAVRYSHFQTAVIGRHLPFYKYSFIVRTCQVATCQLLSHITRKLLQPSRCAYQVVLYKYYRDWQWRFDEVSDLCRHGTIKTFDDRLSFCNCHIPQASWYREDQSVSRLAFPYSPNIQELHQWIDFDSNIILPTCVFHRKRLRILSLH